MSEQIDSAVKTICKEFGSDRTYLMEIARRTQAQFGCVSKRAMTIIAEQLSIPRVEVESLVSFYGFLSEQPRGKIVIRLCNDIIDHLHGYDRVAQAFSEELGIEIGQTTPDGQITLERTACIGMSDQAPAALINDVVVTNLSSDRARQIVSELRTELDPIRLVKRFGDGNNAHTLVRSMVNNNILKEGPVLFSPVNRGEATRKALSMTPTEVIRAVKTARLRGRGGAGFPTGIKWEFTRAAEGDKKFVICNADEGEPGTFKDRVLLTERPDRVLAGMTIAGYAVGAEEGILYLRAEYAYLKEYLQYVLEKRREDGLLGEDICRKICGEVVPRGAASPGFGAPFNFDIRIVMGAGAYICGEETALISSAEGFRGDPKTRPPFPAQKGYLGYPTVVNNVETLCCVTKILEEGPATFNQHGSEQSSGTKLLSISGDCHRPGICEVPLGTTLREVLELVGAEDAIAVQVGGASGEMVPPEQFDRRLCFDDLATGGSIMVFGPSRNILDIVHAFMDFFVEESCGYCTPCRAGNVVLRTILERIRDGRGEPGDLDELERLAKSITLTARCGLGQTSPKPILTSLKNFRPVYEALVQDDPDGFRRAFDLKASLAESEAITGRESVICHA